MKTSKPILGVTLSLGGAVSYVCSLSSSRHRRIHPQPRNITRPNQPHFRQQPHTRPPTNHTMASRRALLCATRLLPTATTCHATPRLVATVRHGLQLRAPLGIAHATPRARFYSQKDDDNVVPGSKIWEFEEITTYLKNPDKNIVFIGMLRRRRSQKSQE